MRKHKKKFIWGIVIVVAVALMIFGSRGSVAGTWADTDVACLPGGHQNALTHIHANLTVLVDGENVSIPANVGVSSHCMAEAHTHTAGGELHIETPARQHNRTIADFFSVWEEPLQRDGYERKIVVNGQPATTEYLFADGDDIVVEFVSADSATSSPATTTDTAATSS
ncbi:MAG: hypothetical protein WD552_03025 [Candidatus Paceibacterota bacterium]